MKKIVNVATPAVCVVALALSVVAFNKTNAATTPDPSPAVANPLWFISRTRRIQRYRPLSTLTPSRISSLIHLAVSLDVDKDKAMAVVANVRYKPRSVWLQVQV